MCQIILIIGGNKMYKRNNVKDIFGRFLKGEISDEDYKILRGYMSGLNYLSELLPYDKSDMFHNFLLKFKQSNPDWDNMSDKHKYCYIRKAFRREMVWRISKTRNFTARHPIVIVHSKFDDDYYDYDKEKAVVEGKPIYDNDITYLGNDVALEDKVDIEKELDNKMLCEYIYNYAASLSDREWNIFYMYYTLGYTYKEIGSKLDITSEYVRQILLKVKNKITTNFTTKGFIY